MVSPSQQIVLGLILATACGSMSLAIDHPMLGDTAPAFELASLDELLSESMGSSPELLYSVRRFKSTDDRKRSTV